MALYHRATITPSKADIVADWAPKQPWYPDSAEAPEVIGAFRFNDPQGQVGIETHLAVVNGTVLHVPVTYRDTPLTGAEDAFICETEHSVLGTRWVYDGLGDPLYLTMLTAVAMTGQGEALGMVEYEGRWHIAPANVRIQGGGWGLDRVPVDEFVPQSSDGTKAVLDNDGFELTVYRQPPVCSARPPMGLVADVSDRDDPLLLAEVRAR